MSNSLSSEKRAICHRCEQPLAGCYCSSLVAIANLVPVKIYQHTAEAKHPLGTARILSLGLQQCQIEGIEDHDNPTAGGINLPFLLFPGREASPVESFSKNQIGTLIVLDGTWRKCKRMLLGSAWLQSLPRISFESVKPSRNYLRKANQPNSLSTVEAAVLALETLESEAGKYGSLLEALDIMVQHQSSHIPKGLLKSRYGR